MSVFSVLEKLVPHVEREVNQIINSKQEANTLRSKLENVKKGLEDAERRGVTDSHVRQWLKELEDVMYKMDDSLDKWETKNLEVDIEQSEYADITDSWEKVRSLFLSFCLSFKHVVVQRQLTLQMKALSARLDKILGEKDTYNFVPNSIDNPQEVEKPAETTSAVDESNVFGRNSDKNNLVDFLLSKDKEQGTQIISIVGVGGLGKTTLAQLVFNDPRIEKHFDLKAWVSISDPFDASWIAKTILRDFNNSSSSDCTLEYLGKQIKATVSKQNFLVVLDNVWTVDRAMWENLKNYLVGGPGCKILVTTRDEGVARTMGSDHWQPLKSLSDSDCATILNRIALRERKEKHDNLCQIGFEIAKKCKGLPLAAKTIGHMLESKFTEKEWRDVLESPLWRYEDEMDDIFRSLRLSFMDLSSIHKRCFLSCVLYPKGSQFDSAELIRIWMAQGYLSSRGKWDDVQTEGNRYFRILVEKSFFEKVYEYEGNITCKMHDVMHEFANHLSKNEFYMILERVTSYIPIDSLERTRYFCARHSSLRALPPNFLIILKRVRVLCLRNCDLEELPRKIGELIHLRYLDLSETVIKELPESLCDLYRLQTLYLQSCSRLHRLPRGIGKLKKLRHLRISGLDLEEFPRRLGKLTDLWTLDEFRATSDSVGCLRNLNELRGYLEIIVEGLNEAAEAEKANLRGKEQIKGLKLIFHQNVRMDVKEAMVPPSQLQTLIVEGRGRQQLPRWITSTSLDNLKLLKICFFHDCYELPPLGKLQKLEELQLWYMNFTSVTPEFLGISNGTSTVVGGFPNLKTFVVYCCSEWEEWEDVEEEARTSSLPIMPRLEKLILVACQKLKALPSRLLLHAATPLKELTIDHCDKLESLYGADQDKISHIRCVNFSRK